MNHDGPTIYLMSGWLAQRLPGVDPPSHGFGHLWYSLLGFMGNPHVNPMHFRSNLAIAAGFILRSSAWQVLFHAKKGGRLAVERWRRTQFLAVRSIVRT